MAGNDVNLTFSASEKGMSEVFQKMERYIDANTRKLEQLGRASEKTSLRSLGDSADAAHGPMARLFGEGTRGAAALTLGATAAGAAFAAMAAAAKVALDAQRELREDAERRAMTGDELLRDYAIAADINPDDQSRMRQARLGILRVAQENAWTERDSIPLATQMESEGFASPAESGALNVMQDVMTATGTKADRGPEMVSAFAQFLNAYNKPLDAEGILQLGTSVRGLKDTPLQLKDFTHAAKFAPFAAAANVSTEDSIAAFTALRKANDAPEAGTYLRNILSSLATSKAGPAPQLAALESLGLKPEDVDLSGENLPEVLKRLNKALAAKPADERLPLLKGLVEKESAGGLDRLLHAEASGELAQFVAAQKDTKSYERAVRLGQAGPNASERRREVEETIAGLPREEQTVREREFMRNLDADVRETMRQNMANPSFGGTVENIGLTTGMKVFQTGLDAGLVPGSIREKMANAPIVDHRLGPRAYSVDEERAKLDRASAVQRGEKLMQERNRIQADASIPLEEARKQIADLQAQIDALKLQAYGHKLPGNIRREVEGTSPTGPVADPRVAAATEATARILKEHLPARPAPAANVPVAASARSRS